MPFIGKVPPPTNNTRPPAHSQIRRHPQCRTHAALVGIFNDVGQYDETGRCTVGEDRQGIRVVHEPAVTLAERDYARAASTCTTTTGDLHPIADCPARRVDGPTAR